MVLKPSNNFTQLSVKHMNEFIYALKWKKNSMDWRQSFIHFQLQLLIESTSLAQYSGERLLNELNCCAVHEFSLFTVSLQISQCIHNTIRGVVVIMIFDSMGFVVWSLISWQCHGVVFKEGVSR